MTRVLICGSSGLLGSRVAHYFHKKSVDFIGTYNKNYVDGAIQVDFLNTDSIKSVILEQSITTCVNCIVERRVDICEDNWSEIKKTNIDITNNIAKVCNDMGVHMIHISTDYVFDGTEAPYTPESKTNPLQNYGISKLISEQRVVRHCPNHTIIRVPVLYSEYVKDLSDSAVTVIGKKILDRTKEYKEDNFSVRRPLYIEDLCPFIYDCTIEGSRGIQHFGNPHDKVSKYIMSEMIAKYLQKSLNVVPVNTPPNDGADRPIDTQLVTKTDGYNFTNIRIGLERCFSKLWHPKIKENPCELFFLIDLDGTLVDTEPLHHDAYHKVLGYDVDVKTIIETRGIDSYLKEKYDTTDFNRIKKEKLEWMLKMNDVKFMKNADTFINTINELGINHCVVTNTNKVVVDHFREKLPLLNKLKNWITREDYDLPKPNSECFELAIKRYKGEEKYIIGFENSEVGYNSLRQVTDCIYLFNENMKSEDCYIINDFNLIY